MEYKKGLAGVNFQRSVEVEELLGSRPIWVVRWSIWIFIFVLGLLIGLASIVSYSDPTACAVYSLSSESVETESRTDTFMSKSGHSSFQDTVESQKISFYGENVDQILFEFVLGRMVAAKDDISNLRKLEAVPVKYIPPIDLQASYGRAREAVNEYLSLWKKETTVPRFLLERPEKTDLANMIDNFTHSSRKYESEPRSHLPDSLYHINTSLIDRFELQKLFVGLERITLCLDSFVLDGQDWLAKNGRPHEWRGYLSSYGDVRNKSETEKRAAYTQGRAGSERNIIIKFDAEDERITLNQSSSIRVEFDGGQTITLNGSFLARRKMKGRLVYVFQYVVSSADDFVTIQEALAKGPVPGILYGQNKSVLARVWQKIKSNANNIW